jgi:hypothetical protein
MVRERERLRMTRSEMERVEAYLRRLLTCEHVRVLSPIKEGLTVEVAVGEEVIGTLYRDCEDGEVSYSVHLTILEEDLPPAREAPVGGPAKPRRTR